MKTGPFFSIVIPTYNRPGLLRQSVRSVLDQTFPDFELIIVDDRSAVPTKDVALSFGDSRICWILNERGRGGAGARNAGIFSARGQWIAFLDDDDVWLPEKLSRVREKIFETGGRAGLIYTGYATYDFERHEELCPRLPEREGWLQDRILSKNYIGTFSAVTIRTELLRQVGGLDERFPALQDMELYCRITTLTRVAFVNKKLSLIRTSNRDRISFCAEKQLQAGILLWEKNRNRINKEPKLRHRAAARVFMYAAQVRDLGWLLKSVPWTLLGIFIDSQNLTRTFRNITSFYRAALVRSLSKYSPARKIIEALAKTSTIRAVKRD